MGRDKKAFPDIINWKRDDAGFYRFICSFTDEDSDVCAMLCNLYTENRTNISSHKVNLHTIRFLVGNCSDRQQHCDPVYDAI